MNPPHLIRTCFLSGCLLLAVGSSAAVAQQGIDFNHLTVSDGLSQGSVICIFQDREGFMWFGTQGGLNRYDGYKFKVYKHDPAVEHSLSDDFITTIGEDSSGTLWIGTIGTPTMYNRFDPLTETFEQVPRDSVDTRGWRMSGFRVPYVDSSGTRWICSSRGGLTREDLRTGTKKVYTHDASNPKSILSDNIYSVVPDPSGALWIGTKEGLERFDPGIGTFEHFTHREGDPRSLSDSFVWPLLMDRDGTLWVGTYAGGLNRMERGSRTFTRFEHDEANPRSLSVNQIYSLYQDRSGMIWIGTADHGIDRFHPDLASFRLFSHQPGNQASLIDNNVLGMTVTRSGTAWIGTKGGLDRWDRARNRFVHFRHDDRNPGSIADDQVQSLLEDRNGTLWVGTVSHGLDRYNRSTGTFTHFTHRPSDRRSLSDDRVYALCEDRSGALWVGTYGGGLNKFNRSTGRFDVYQHNDSVATSLGGSGVMAILEDHAGTLWIGTIDGGLDRFDRTTEQFVHFAHSDSDTTSLSNNFVLCLYEDRSGTLWIGTGEGLNSFDRTSGTVRRYRQRNGLAGNLVFGILEDEESNLWISTGKGLSRLSPDRETFRNFDVTDGLQSNEFNQGAYAMDPHTGEMLFGGPNGFNVFQPADVKENTYVPPVVFTAFTRYNTDDKQGTPINEDGISVRKTVTLSYKDNVANFEFSALSFYNNFKNKYAYRLEGFNDNWIHLGNGRQATFTNLDGGEYVLHVRGSNDNGVWNNEGASLEIIVTPPWWKTRWAYGSYVVIIVGLLYVGRRFELNQKEQKAKMRESELHAKAVEAEKRALQAENDRKTKELEDARRLQLSMLPNSVPELPGYEIAVFMKTATEVGGDYYDFRLAKDGTLDVAFGDATGHGMQAGAIVTLMKGLFLSDSSRFDIQTFFNHCSQAIKQIKLGRLYMAFTLVRLKGNSVSFSSAGMPPVYLYRKSEASVKEILLKGMPLGAMKTFPYALHETELESGDTLLLLTDGLPEQKNGHEEMFDYRRVEQAFAELGTAPPNDTIKKLVEAGESWMEGVVQDDDITIMVIKKKES